MIVLLLLTPRGSDSYNFLSSWKCFCRRTPEFMLQSCKREQRHQQFTKKQIDTQRHDCDDVRKTIPTTTEWYWLASSGIRDPNVNARK